MSPLDDNAMYLQLAQQAAARGNPAQGPSGASALTPPGGGPGGPPASPIPQPVMQKFIMGLPQVIPQITPEQAKGVAMLLMGAFKGEEQMESPLPPPPGPQMPPGGMQ